jgi:hypothetical protein
VNEFQARVWPARVVGGVEEVAAGGCVQVHVIGSRCRWVGVQVHSITDSNMCISPSKESQSSFSFTTSSDTLVFFHPKVRSTLGRSRNCSHLGRDDPQRCHQIKIMPFIQTFLAKRKCKSEGYYDVCVQYVALSCCMSAEQMSKSKQCKVPTKEDQRLDHAKA